MVSASVAEKFWGRIVPNDETGCWEWAGTKSGGGYGRLTIAGRTIAAHRFSYELLAGPIPEGLVIDHLCRNRACANPGHLEPVTEGENIRRGEGPSALNMRKDRCVKGHKFTPDNTYIRPGTNYRVCRECQRIAQSARPKNRVRDPRSSAVSHRRLYAAEMGLVQKTCVGCGGDYAVRKDGTLRLHNRRRFEAGEWLTEVCPGAKQLPAQAIARSAPSTTEPGDER